MLVYVVLMSALHMVNRCEWSTEMVDVSFGSYRQCFCGIPYVLQRDAVVGHA